jgi:clan AA aspartic protease
MNPRGDNGMGKVTVDVELTNYRDKVLAEAGSLAPEKVRRVRASALVDTGASYLVLPKKVAAQLGVTVLGKAKVRYADMRRATRQVVRDVGVDLLGRQGTYKAIVEPTRDKVLVGAIVLEDLDLLVDCRTQTLKRRDPKDIITEIE